MRRRTSSLTHLLIRAQLTGWGSSGRLRQTWMMSYSILREPKDPASPFVSSLRTGYVAMRIYPASKSDLSTSTHGASSLWWKVKAISPAGLSSRPTSAQQAVSVLQ